MTDRAFTDIAASLCQVAVRAARQAGVDAAQAEDVVQDCLLRLWTLRQSITSEQHLRGLAVVVARHQAYDVLRGHRLESIDAVGAQVAQTPSSQTDMEMAEDESWLAQRLCQLPPMQHQILHLRQVEQKTNGEIAAILGITTASVATLLSRARHKLLDDLRRRNRSVR